MSKMVLIVQGVVIIGNPIAMGSGEAEEEALRVHAGEDGVLLRDAQIMGASGITQVSFLMVKEGALGAVGRQVEVKKGEGPNPVKMLEAAAEQAKRR